jgi:hypothetical protein
MAQAGQNRKGMQMRAILTGLLSAALVLGLAGAADAKSQKTVTYYYYTYETQPTLAERQSRASTFDQTKYYERDSRKIPFGTAEWWRQMEREGGRKR